MQVATIVTARLGSSRLPGKMLAPLRGRPVIERLLERVALAQRPDVIVLATTTERQDDTLAQAAADLGVAVFRGSTEDILVRWRDTAIAHGADLIVNCDGDDVFCDPVHIDRVIATHEETGAEFITCTGLPLGAAPTGIALSGLVRVCAQKVETNTEGQGRFFASPGVVTRTEVAADERLSLPTARMTLDYPEDLAFFDAVLAEFEPAVTVPSLAEIVDLLRRRPDIVAINSACNERYWQRFNAMYGPVELKPA
jgi:spore coat polysaccharide biosynthesis protein SpsF